MEPYVAELIGVAVAAASLYSAHAKTMVPIRVAAIVGNILAMAVSFMLGTYPIFMLNTALLAFRAISHSYIGSASGSILKEWQMKKSMPGRSTCSWSGGGCGGWRNADCLDNSAQQVTQGYQIKNRCHNAGSYYEFGVYCPGEQLPRLRTHVCESDNRERSSKADVKHSFAERFWNVVGIYHFNLLRLIGHN